MPMSTDLAAYKRTRYELDVALGNLPSVTTYHFATDKVAQSWVHRAYYFRKLWRNSHQGESPWDDLVLRRSGSKVEIHPLEAAIEAAEVDGRPMDVQAAFAEQKMLDEAAKQAEADAAIARNKRPSFSNEEDLF